MTDGRTDAPIIKQCIPFTDFPLSEIKLYLVYSGDDNWVLMLPSEY
jgi:hypothetical protein